MNLKHIFVFFISIFLYSISTKAQITTISKVIDKTKSIADNQRSEQEIDTIKKKREKKEHVFALRIGADLYKYLILSELVSQNKDYEYYKGYEWAADFSIYRNLSLAIEIGHEDKMQKSESLYFSTKGDYTKIGIDINTYNNWLGMSNAIYIGFRYGYSKHSQELTQYSIYVKDRFWDFNETINGQAIGKRENLNAEWAEFIFGIKTELFFNIYLGIGLQLKFLLDETAPENFGNLYIPGFHKSLDDINIGIGINYTLSYSIPFFKTKL